MKYGISLLLCIGLFLYTGAQIKSRLHVVTTWDNRQASLRLHCTINGTLYKLLPGKCLELELAADSLHVVMTDTRWIKKETVDLHVPAAEDIYVHIFWGREKVDPKRIVRSMAELVCKSCFDELKKKCRKTITEKAPVAWTGYKQANDSLSNSSKLFN